MTDTQEFEDFREQLERWREVEPPRRINDILTRIQKSKLLIPNELLTKLQQTLVTFHKQINKKQAAQKVDQGWFKLVLDAKKYVRKMMENSKKKTRVEVFQENLIKSDSKIEFPAELCENTSTEDELILQCLYKNFLINLPQDVLENKESITAFIRKLLNCLYQQFGINKDKQYAQDYPQFMQRMKDLTEKLKNKKTSAAKMDMIEGKIDAEGVAKLDETFFISQKAKKKQKQRMEAFQKENETGFYDEMKKNINKDACEQCRFCHKNTAYCEGQKQIRAADEPMTRFMKCNTCGKQWRQE